jgi:hypothetical protein
MRTPRPGRTGQIQNIRALPPSPTSRLRTKPRARARHGDGGGLRGAEVRQACAGARHAGAMPTQRAASTLHSRRRRADAETAMRPFAGCSLRCCRPPRNGATPRHARTTAATAAACGRAFPAGTACSSDLGQGGASAARGAGAAPCSTRQAACGERGGDGGVRQCKRSSDPPRVGVLCFCTPQRPALHSRLARHSHAAAARGRSRHSGAVPLRQACGRAGRLRDAPRHPSASCLRLPPKLGRSSCCSALRVRARRRREPSSSAHTPSTRHASAARCAAAAQVAAQARA